ncbi:MAG: phosphoribosylformylglycinamidine cyclo-ligase [Microthrixaceae bacterium]
MTQEAGGATYAAAGVSLDAGDEAVRRILPMLRRTHNASVLSDIGGFGGLFELPAGYERPVLVSSTDGVGTKLEVARLADRWDTVGLDLVAMVVDDLVCCGATPLFFLDYLAVGRLDPDRVEQLMAGLVAGCEQAGCALVGGEMAEHPGTMEPDALDVAGFAVGVVERDRLITGESVRPGDSLVGLVSPGLRSNGFSLARAVLIAPDDPAGSLAAPAYGDVADGPSVADELLCPSVIYAPAVAAMLGESRVHALAHITGGGLVGNLPRVMPPDTAARLDPKAWERPPIVSEIARRGSVAEDELRRVFNLGIGMVVVTPDPDAAIAAARSVGTDAALVGEVTAEPGEAHVTFVGD